MAAKVRRVFTGSANFRRIVEMVTRNASAYLYIDVGLSIKQQHCDNTGIFFFSKSKDISDWLYSFITGVLTCKLIVCYQTDERR